MAKLTTLRHRLPFDQCRHQQHGKRFHYGESLPTDYVGDGLSFRGDSDTENRISAKLPGEGHTAVDANIVEPDKTPNPHNLLPKPELLPRVILTLWRLRSLDKRRDQLAISWTDRPIPNGLEEGRRETDCSTPQ